MANMSYCRYQNTLKYLQDCYEAILGSEKLSASEEKAKDQLIKLCAQIVSIAIQSESAAISTEAQAMAQTLEPIENFHDHPSRKGNVIERIYYLNGLFYLANAEKLQQITPTTLAYANLGEPYREFGRLYYKQAGNEQQSHLEISMNDAAQLLFFCQSCDIALDIHRALEHNRDFQRFYHPEMSNQEFKDHYQEFQTQH